jgi:DNA modification methylase
MVDGWHLADVRLWDTGAVIADKVFVFAASKAGADRVLETEPRLWPLLPQAEPGAIFYSVPEQLAADCIALSTEPGDAVLDPFGGVGNIAKAATSLGRDAVLIEIDPRQTWIAESRLQVGERVHA